LVCLCSSISLVFLCSPIISFLVLSQFVLLPCGLQFCLCAGRMSLWPRAVSSRNIKPCSCPAVSDLFSRNLLMIGGSSDFLQSFW
jgi:hypothetical protein